MTQGVDIEICRSLERVDDLSPREHEVFLLLRSGPSSRDLSERLSISERTVKAHLVNILKKLGLTTRLQACIAALLHEPAGRIPAAGRELVPHGTMHDCPEGQWSPGRPPC